MQMPTTDSVYKSSAGHKHQYSNSLLAPRILFRTGELISNVHGTLLPALMCFLCSFVVSGTVVYHGHCLTIIRCLLIFSERHK